MSAALASKLITYQVSISLLVAESSITALPNFLYTMELRYLRGMWNLDLQDPRLWHRPEMLFSAAVNSSPSAVADDARLNASRW
jgi:hypothetical protein